MWLLFAYLNEAGAIKMCGFCLLTSMELEP